MPNTNSYEIERKFLVNTLPDNLNSYPHYELEQGYLSVAPVVRVRRKDTQYILTYKSGGMLKRMEVELPLDSSSYNHLIAKADGIVISKTRYAIPHGKYIIELDIFHGKLDGFVMAEVEFDSIEDADSYEKPDWFSVDVTANPAFHNSRMSRMTDDDCREFFELFHSLLIEEGALSD